MAVEEEIQSAAAEFQIVVHEPERAGGRRSGQGFAPRVRNGGLDVCEGGVKRVATRETQG
jgi:hypothetical protein